MGATKSAPRRAAANTGSKKLGEGVSFCEQLHCLQGNMGTAEPTAKAETEKENKKKRLPRVKGKKEPENLEKEAFC